MHAQPNQTNRDKATKHHGEKPCDGKLCKLWTHSAQCLLSLITQSLKYMQDNLSQGKTSFLDVLHCPLFDIWGVPAILFYVVTDFSDTLTLEHCPFLKLIQYKGQLDMCEFNIVRFDSIKVPLGFEVIRMTLPSIAAQPRRPSRFLEIAGKGLDCSTATVT